MSKLIIAVVIGLTGLIIGVNIADNSSSIASVEPPVMQNSYTDNALKNQLDALTSQLTLMAEQVQQEAKERQRMADELKTLKQTLLNLEENQSNLINTPVTQNDTSMQIITPVTNTTVTDNFTDSDFEEPKSTSNILASIGIDPVIAENIERRSEKREMEQLYLRNKAVREGWFGTEKYFEETNSLEQKTNVVREEIGDAKYDEYLYVSGKFNRIKVSGVIATSPAENVGIRTGDIIYSYDNKRIFTWSDITTMTAAGEPGETVEVSVIRDKVISKLFIPRGPMGIRLESMRLDPTKS